MSPARAALVGFSLLAAAPLGAQALRSDQASQVIQISIRPVNAIRISGSPAFTVPGVRASRDTVTLVSEDSYALTTNEVHRNVSIALDAPMPMGTALAVELEAPTGAESNGELTLSTAPQRAVTGVSRVNERGLAIRYRLTVMPRTSVAPTNRLIVITLAAGT
jgi:hypothetical protein